jgi:hypothetical protein
LAIQAPFRTTVANRAPFQVHPNSGAILDALPFGHIQNVAIIAKVAFSVVRTAEARVVNARSTSPVVRQLVSSLRAGVVATTVDELFADFASGADVALFAGDALGWTSHTYARRVVVVLAQVAVAVTSAGEVVES